MRKLLNIVYGLVLLAVTSHAGAVVLSLEPSSQNAAPGDSVSLDLVISGLGNGGPDSLGDFDIDIGFDTSALIFTSYSLGNSLGDLGAGEAVDFSGGDLGGTVNLAEVSLLFPFELDALQTDTFTLATLNFDVYMLDPGTSTTVDISTVWALGDGFGLPLTVDAANSAVIRNAAGVPEPSVLALVALGLTGVGFASRRRKA